MPPPASPSPPIKPRPIPWRERRFALLFFFLLASILLYPYAESSRFGYYAFRTLGSAIVLLSVYAITFRRHLVILVLCLAVPALVQHAFVAPSDVAGIVPLQSRTQPRLRRHRRRHHLSQRLRRNRAQLRNRLRRALRLPSPRLRLRQHLRPHLQLPAKMPSTSIPSSTRTIRPTVSTSSITASAP